MSGLYQDGLESLQDTFRSDYIQKYPTYLLSALRQMVYYGIQVNQPELMQEYIRQGLTLSKDNRMWLEHALFLRLLGLLAMLQGNYTECFEHLKESIKLLENHGIPLPTRILNISAAYHYLGEMERRQKQYEKAIDYYLTAIDLCRQHTLSPVATYYTDLGCAYYESGQKETAYPYFLLASEIYDNSFTLMGRSVAKGYCAVYYCEKGDFATARTYLTAAGNAAAQLGSPMEMEELRRIQTKLSVDYPEELSELRTDR